MSEYTIKTVSGSVVRFDDAGDGLPLTNCEVNIVPTIETGTVSGSVVTFSDGADDVPIKSASFGIVASGGGGTPSSPVPIVGASSVTVYHGKKNVFDITTYPITTGKAIRTSDGGLVNSSVTNRGATQDYIPCISMRGKTWIINKPNQSGNSVGLAFYDENNGFLSAVQTYPSGTNGVFTVPNNAYSFRFTVNLDSADDTEIQIEAGTTATAFSPFFAPVSVTVSLGQTVYGGTLAEDGTLTITHIFATFDGSIDEEWTYNSTSAVFYINISEDYKKETLLIDHISNIFESVGQISSVSGMGTNRPDMSITFSSGPNNRIYLKCSTYTSTEDFKTFLSNTNLQITIPLATPIVVTGLDEISLSTYLDYNTLWSDYDLSVIYYKNGYNTKMVDVVREGKNIMLPLDGDEWEDGAINASGKNTTAVNSRRTKGYIAVKNNTDFRLVLSGYTNTGTNDRFRLFKYDKNKVFLSYASLAAQNGYSLDGASYIRMRYYTDSITWNNAQLEYRPENDTTATAYKPYVEPATYTVNLGHSINGGTVNVLKGTGISKYAMAAFPDCSWSCITSYQSNFNATNGIISVRFGKTAMGNAGYALTTEGVVCNNFANNNRSVWNNVDRLNEIGYADGIVINMHYSDIGLEAWTDNSSTTLAAWKSSELYLSGIFALIKATPEPFTFTPIQLTSHSSNTLWSTEGDITVSYYSYIETDGRYLIYGDTLTDIANAIREKTSIVGPINVNDFVTDIMTIDDAAPDAEEVEF